MGKTLDWDSRKQESFASFACWDLGRATSSLLCLRVSICKNEINSLLAVLKASAMKHYTLLLLMMPCIMAVPNNYNALLLTGR